MSMKKRDDESSSQHSVRNPFILVALGAIFLFPALSQGSQAPPDSLFAYAGSVRRVAQIHSRKAVVFEAPELLMSGKISLRAASPHMTLNAKALGALMGDPLPGSTAPREVFHYRAEEGDTVAGLAERFGISENTILWANELSASAQLQAGKELLIPPVSGALHLVRPGDTLSEIALWYKADMDEILRFNDIGDAKDIFVGDLLLIPGGTKPAKLPAGRLTHIAGSYFITPVPSSYRITQGLHPYNAVDFSNGACGGPVYAAAGGVVQRAGYHSVAGNYVRILHPNGVVTLYGHLSDQAVKPGERVLQGQIVGYAGHSGYTIPAGPAGCHVHFEVRGAANPFAK